MANSVFRNTGTPLPDSPALTALGFRPIPFDEIGLYADAYRASWPVNTTPAAVPDWRNVAQ